MLSSTKLKSRARNRLSELNPQPLKLATNVLKTTVLQYAYRAGITAAAGHLFQEEGLNLSFNHFMRKVKLLFDD